MDGRAVTLGSHPGRRLARRARDVRNRARGERCRAHGRSPRQRAAGPNPGCRRSSAGRGWHGHRRWRRRSTVDPGSRGRARTHPRPHGGDGRLGGGRRNPARQIGDGLCRRGRPCCGRRSRALGQVLRRGLRLGGTVRFGRRRARRRRPLRSRRGRRSQRGWRRRIGGGRRSRLRDRLHRRRWGRGLRGRRCGYRRRRRRGRGGWTRREQRERIDVAVLVVGSAYAEVDVRGLGDRVLARSHGADRDAFADLGSAPDVDRAELEQGHGVAVGRRDRDRAPAAGHGAGKRDGAGRRRADGRAEIGADVDASVLPALVRVGAESERPQHRALDGPRPGCRARGRKSEQQDDDEQDTTHAHASCCQS
jgi:hypothetical protein